MGPPPQGERVQIRRPAVGYRRCRNYAPPLLLPHSPCMGSIPGQGQFFCPSESTLVRGIVGTHPNKCVRTLKIPYASVVTKRVGLTAGGMETRKHCPEGNKLGSAVLRLLAFPEETGSIFVCVTLGQGTWSNPT